MTLSFEERLSRLAETDINLERIKVIDRCFGTDYSEKLAIPGRALVGEGILIKECRKKPKPRYFFLFNDILVYGTCVINKKKYINQHIIPLDNVQIKSINDSSNPKLRNGWMIMSPKKTFCVYATTAREKIEWMTHISNCIDKLSNGRGLDRNLITAPKWIPDKEADTCMRCQSAKFNMVNRRHHCRNCGYVVCGDCSRNKFLIASQSNEPLRVCNTCYSILKNGNPNLENKSIQNSLNTDSSDESDDETNSASGNNGINDENTTQFYSTK
jgi:pleckstrin homology domain-containing family F